MALLKKAQSLFPQSTLLVMPSYKPPPTSLGGASKIPRASFKHRCQMLTEALEEYKISAEISTLEGDMVGRGYTWHVLKALEKNPDFKAPFVWVLGEDLLEGLPHWYLIHELLGKLTLCIAARKDHPKVRLPLAKQVLRVLEKLDLDHNGGSILPPSSHSETLHTLIHTPKVHLLTFDFQSPHSSSEVRKLLQQRHLKEAQTPSSLLEDLLPSSVLTYINKHHLYPPPLPLPFSPAVHFIEELCLKVHLHKALGVEVICKDPHQDHSVVNRRSLWDYQVVCWGRSHRHSTSLAREIMHFARLNPPWKVIGVEGLEQGIWVALDLATIIVHIFDHTHYPHLSSQHPYQNLPGTLHWHWHPETGWHEASEE